MLSGRNEAFPEANSSATANGYVSRKRCVFLLLGQHFVEKNDPMLPGKFMCQDY